MMWQERPVFGFGPGTFPDLVPEFAGRVPTAVRQPAEAPHNIYFELAAESGTLGLISWLLLILAALTILGLRICSAPRAPERVLAAAVFAAIVGWSVSSLALHLAYFRTFALILALAGCLAPAWPVSARVWRRYLDAVVACVLAAIIGAGVFAATWAIGASRVVAVTQHTTLTPVGQVDGWYAYALDIRSRVELLPTMARLLHQRGSAVEVQPDPEYADCSISLPPLQPRPRRRIDCERPSSAPVRFLAPPSDTTTTSWRPSAPCASSPRCRRRGATWPWRPSPVAVRL